MADQSKLLFVNAAGEVEESSIADQLKYTNFETNGAGGSFNVVDSGQLGKIGNSLYLKAFNQSGATDGNDMLIVSGGSGTGQAGDITVQTGSTSGTEGKIDFNIDVDNKMSIGSAEISLSSSFVPSADNTYDLGANDAGFQDAYTHKLKAPIGSGLTIGSNDADGIFLSAANTAFYPAVTNALDLGTSSQVYKDAFIRGLKVDAGQSLKIYSQDGTVVADFLDGGISMSEAIDMNSNKITEVGTPSAGTDAANKDYVDTAVGAVDLSGLATRELDNLTTTSINADLIPADALKDLGANTAGGADRWANLFAANVQPESDGELTLSSANASQRLAIQNGGTELTGQMYPNAAFNGEIGTQTVPFGTMNSSIYALSDGTNKVGSMEFNNGVNSKTAGIALFSTGAGANNDILVGSELGDIILTAESEIRVDANVRPDVTNVTDLGTSSLNFKDVHARRMISADDLNFDTTGPTTALIFKRDAVTKLTLGDNILAGTVLDMNSNKIINLAAPTNDNDGATKAYVDSVAEGLKPKEAVKAASAGSNVVIASELENGDILDGVTLATGDRVLLKDQTAPAENGIYIVAATGAASRATDMDSLTPIDEVNGAYVPVQEGTANAGKFFVQQGTVATIGTDPINFVFFNATATLSAGNGIDITTNIISVDTDGQGLEVGSGQLVLELDGSSLAKSASGLKIADDGVQAIHLNADTAGLGLVQAVGGELDVNVDDSTIEIATDTVQIKDDGVTGAKLAPAVAGNGLVQDGSGNLDVNVDGVGIEIVGDALQLKDDGVTAAKLNADTAGAGLVQAAGGELDVNVDSSLQVVTDQVGILFSTLYNDAKAIAAQDLSSTAVSKGASIIGVQDVAGYFTNSNVEAVLAELYEFAATGAAEEFTVENGYTTVKGDLLYISSDNRVENVDTSATGTASMFGFALASAGGIVGDVGGTTSVEAYHDGQVLTAVLPAATFSAGDKVYYDSSQTGSARFVTLGSAPSLPQSRVWQVGVAKNASDLIIDINFIKKNS